MLSQIAVFKHISQLFSISSSIVRFHSRGNRLCKFTGTKESTLSSCLEIQYGCRDVTCETLYLEKQKEQKGPACTRSPPPTSLNLRHLYFQKCMLSHGLPGIPGSNGMPGMSGVPGPQGPQGREGAKGQPGDKGSQGTSGPQGDRGREGPPGRSGQPGIKGVKGDSGLVGMKGEPGIVGNQGRKGDKGDKGESAKASQASVVPQTNWKQCVWKSASDTDNGKIKVNKGRAE